MRGRIFILPVLAIVAMNTGCSSDPPALSTVGAGPVSYSCVLADAYSPAVPDPAAPRGRRRRSVTLAVTGGRVVLYLGSGNTQYLDPVDGGRGRLFANTSYGWNITNTRSVLTDIQNVLTYNCNPAAPRHNRTSV